MTGYQAQRFLDGLGDDWLERNRNIMDKVSNDPVEKLIDEIKLPLGGVLEVGCANGWRLKNLKEKYKCDVTGIDPSEKAIAEAAKSGIHAYLGTADNLSFADNQFDTVIMGFCMSLIDPIDNFKVCSETSRILKDGGFIIIWDYICPRPFKMLFPHYEGEPADMFLHIYDWSKLWLAHPGYQVAAESFDVEKSSVVSILIKHFDTCFPRTYRWDKK